MPSFVADHPDAVLADVRWYLDGRDGNAAFEAATSLGALWVDLDTQLAGHDQPVTEGRHPFPTPAGLRRRHGIARHLRRHARRGATTTPVVLTAGRLA